MAEAGARNRDETSTASGASGGRALREADGHARVARQIEAPRPGRLTDRDTLAPRATLAPRLAVMLAHTLEALHRRLLRQPRPSGGTRSRHATCGGGFAVLADGFWSALVLRTIAGIGWAGCYMPGLKAIADRLDGAAQSRAVTWHAAGVGIAGRASGAWSKARVAAGLAGPRIVALHALRRRDCPTMQLRSPIFFTAFVILGIMARILPASAACRLSGQWQA